MSTHANSKTQRKLELRTTGGHPDSLTSPPSPLKIDLMTANVLASLFCLQLIKCSRFFNIIENNCLFIANNWFAELNRTVSRIFKIIRIRDKVRETDISKLFKERAELI